MNHLAYKRDSVECLGWRAPPITRLVLAALLLFALVGCGTSSDADDPVAPAADNHHAAAGDAGSSESWIALYMGDDKVGYEQIQRRPVQRNGDSQIEIDRKHVFNALRYQGLSEIQTSAHVVETPDQRLIRFESIANLGSGEVKLSGRVDAGKLLLEVQSAGGSHSESIPWSDVPCGAMAWEHSLEAQPLEPGETRALKMLDIGVDRAQPVDVRLQAEDTETTQLLDGPASLLRVRVTIAYPGRTDNLVVTAWCDRQGKVLKTEFPLLNKNVTAYVTTREAALAKGAPPKLDIGLSATVKVERQLEHPHATRRIVYEARLPNGDPSTAFLTTAGQSVEKIDEHTARVTVTAVRPVTGPAPPGAAANPGDLAPNALIESDAPEVVALARSVAPAERDPWKLAVALEKLVAERVQNDNFSTALATAAQTARTKKGDCTEHAMLLAGLCRARKIPARVAIGLVYVDPPSRPEQRGFAYHMWTEVSINGEWIPIDGTLGRGGIGAAHLTLIETNFKDAGIDAFLPVFNVIGKLQLKIVEVE